MRPKILPVLVFFLVALPLGAQNWVVYDDFAGPFIDITRWRAEWSDPCFEFIRQIRSGQLELSMRCYGRTDLDYSQTHGLNRLDMVDLSSFKGIRIKLTVMKVMGYDPGGQGWGDDIGVRASFFNAGTGSPDDDLVADLLMYVATGANSQKIPVGGAIRTRAIDYGGVVLGDITIGEPAYIWVRWDNQAKKFFFGFQPLRRNSPPIEKELAYALPDGQPPADPYAMMGLQTWLSDSTGFQSYSDMAVKIDRVDVLR